MCRLKTHPHRSRNFLQRHSLFTKSPDYIVPLFSRQVTPLEIRADDKRLRIGSLALSGNLKLPRASVFISVPVPISARLDSEVYQGKMLPP